MDILDKIDLYSHTYNDMRDMEILIEMALLVDDVTLNEAFDIGMLKKTGSSLLKKIGMGSHKTGDGLIQIALKSGKIMAEFVYHALKAAAGNDQSKIRVRELAATKITKEQFMDFLLKIDYATLSLISGPLHIIEALTGWHIWSHVKSQTETSLSKAKQAIQDLAYAAKSTNDEVKKKLKGLMHGIARLFGIDDIQTTIKSV